MFTANSCVFGMDIYGSKFSWYNNFVNFMIELAITKILFMKYLYVCIYAFTRHVITIIYFGVYSFHKIRKIF